MPTLNWIGKEAVVKHHKDVPFRLLEPVPELSCGGSESGNTTTLEFSIPLKSGDPNDGVIDPKADTKVMLAYGPDRDSTKLKHQFAKTVTINLANGPGK